MLVCEGRFHELKGCSATAVAVSFRPRFLNALQKQEILDGDMIERLISWDHNSGFSVHAGKPINGADREVIERQARYMSRTPLSVERIHYHADDHSLTVDGGKSHAGLKKWTVPEYSLNVRKVLVITGTECRAVTRAGAEHGITDPDFTLSDEILDFPADADVILVSIFFHRGNLLGASGTIDIS